MCDQQFLHNGVEVGSPSKVKAAVVPLVWRHGHWFCTTTAETGAVTVRNVHVVILEKVGVSFWTRSYDPAHVGLWACGDTGTAGCPRTLYTAVTTERRVHGSEAPRTTVHKQHPPG